MIHNNNKFLKPSIVISLLVLLCTSSILLQFNSFSIQFFGGGSTSGSSSNSTTSEDEGYHPKTVIIYKDAIMKNSHQTISKVKIDSLPPTLDFINTRSLAQKIISSTSKRKLSKSIKKKLMSLTTSSNNNNKDGNSNTDANNAWNLLLNFYEDDGSAIPSFVKSKTKETGENPSFPPESAKCTKSKDETVMPPNKHEIQVDVDDTRPPRFSCNLNFDKPGDWQHCEPVLHASSSSASSFTSDQLFDVSVPFLGQEPRSEILPTVYSQESVAADEGHVASNKENPPRLAAVSVRYQKPKSQNKKNRQLKWTPSLSMSNLTKRMPINYYSCRVISDHGDQSLKIKTLRFYFEENTKGPDGCILPSSNKIYVDWTSPAWSRSHARNHISIRLAAASPKRKGCKISVQTFAISNHRSRCFPFSDASAAIAHGMSMKKALKLFLSDQSSLANITFHPKLFFPTAFDVPKTLWMNPRMPPISSIEASSLSQKERKLLTYSIEVGDFGSLDIFDPSSASSTSGNKNYIPLEEDVYSSSSNFKSFDSKRYCGVMFDRESKYFSSLREGKTVQKTKNEADKTADENDDNDEEKENEAKNDIEDGDKTSPKIKPVASKSVAAAMRNRNNNARRSKQNPDVVTPLPHHHQSKQHSHRNRVENVLRCETGLYMGYTNIIQGFVTCAVIARLCKRTVLEFPLQLHHTTFDQIFDLKFITRKLEQRFGITLRLYAEHEPADDNKSVPSSSSNPNAADESLIAVDRPHRRRDLDQFLNYCSARPWATVFIGDMWRSRMNVAAHDFHVEFLDKVMLPSKKVLLYAQTILDRFGFYYRTIDDAKETSQKQQQKHQQQQGFPFVAIHLRFEDDAINLNQRDSSSNKKKGDTFSSVVNRARRLRDYINRVYPSYSVYYASGKLHSSISKILPLHSEFVKKEMRKRAATSAKDVEENHHQHDQPQQEEAEEEQAEQAEEKTSNLDQQDLWLNKDDFFPLYTPNTMRPWKKIFQGTYFDGRPVNITNATGSAVDFHVLLHAPVAIVAEFSSFGEAVAAARCARGWPVWMYDAEVKGVRAVNCEDPVLFRRPLQEIIRRTVRDLHVKVEDARDYIAYRVNEELTKSKTEIQKLYEREKLRNI